ncbi:hypothetical protein ABTF48_20080, partial [Acinetobacter baumannii]
MGGGQGLSPGPDGEASRGPGTPRSGGFFFEPRVGGDAFAEGRAEAFLQSDGGQGRHAKRTFSPVVESFLL